MNWLKIIKDGVTIDHREMGMMLLEFTRQSSAPENEQKQINGRPGHIPLGTQHGGSTSRAVFFAESRNPTMLQLLLDEIYELFRTNDEMSIIDMKQPGKVWDVKVVNQMEPDYIGGANATIEVEFESSKAFARSLGTTQDPKTFEAGVWQFGQGLIADETKYTFTTTEFSVYNAGNQTIDPRHLPLLIEFKGVSSNLRIRNMTTGEELHYSGSTNASDTLRLDRCRVTKNQTSVYRETNKRAIKLVPGSNRFRLTGTSGTIQIKFIHHFYTT